jgi:hypothetical protein
VRGFQRRTLFFQLLEEFSRHFIFVLANGAPNPQTLEQNSAFLLSYLTLHWLATGIRWPQDSTVSTMSPTHKRVTTYYEEVQK